MNAATRCITIVLLFACGCSLNRPYPSKELYVLPSSDLEPASVSRPVMLGVARASVAPPFDSRAFQYRVGEARYEPTYYAQWADDPGSLVTTAVSRSIGSTGAFIVLDDASGARVPLLRLQVTDLHVDVRDADEPRVVLSIRATVLDPRGDVVMTWAAKRTSPSASEQPADVVDAFGASITDLARELTPELRAALGGS